MCKNVFISKFLTFLNLKSRKIQREKAKKIRNVQFGPQFWPKKTEIVTKKNQFWWVPLVNDVNDGGDGEEQHQCRDGHGRDHDHRLVADVVSHNRRNGFDVEKWTATFCIHRKKKVNSTINIIKIINNEQLNSIISSVIWIFIIIMN